MNRSSVASDWSRRLTAETSFTPSDLIWPLFLIDGDNVLDAGAGAAPCVQLVLDASGSMVQNEGRFQEVAAGVKMLIATMDPSYRFDIVYFQSKQGDPVHYRAFRSALVSVDEQVKYEAYRFLADLAGEVDGGTPTAEVMEYVLTSPTYAEAGNVILLTDGLPNVAQGDGISEAEARRALAADLLARAVDLIKQIIGD